MLKQAYDFREQLTALFDGTHSKAVGLQRIKAWRRRVEAIAWYDEKIGRAPAQSSDAGATHAGTAPTNLAISDLLLQLYGVQGWDTGKQ